MPSKTTTTAAAKKPSGKNYTPEFITKALATWEKGKKEGKTAMEVSKSLGVHNSMLYYWKARKDGKPWGKKKVAKSNGHAPIKTILARTPDIQRARARVAASDREARREAPHSSTDVTALKREIAQLKEECEVLKKTVVVFARGR